MAHEQQAKENLYSKYKYIWEQLDNTMDSLFWFIQKYPVIEMDDFGNITVANTQDPRVPAFCCHLDTVHRKEPDLELINNQVLMSMNDAGVGGDDKCGIVACLELLERVPCKCLFFRDEESGCRGSNKFNADSLKNNLFCIEIDRRGASDLIFSGSRGCMCSDEFKERVKTFFPHCKPAQGSLTDVCVLGEAEINMMNLSAGYYRPHTDKEYVVLPELELNIDCLERLAKDILEHPLKDYKYKRSATNYGFYTGKSETKATWKSYTGGSELFPATTTAGEDDYYQCQYGHRKDEPEDINKSIEDYYKRQEEGHIK